jgi:hypothetical protein
MRGYLARAVGAMAYWLARASRWARVSEAALSARSAPANRADLLSNPQPGDECDAFEAHGAQWAASSADCQGDGHYLCSKCARLDPAGWRGRGGDEDEAEQGASDGGAPAVDRLDHEKE